MEETKSQRWARLNPEKRRAATRKYYRNHKDRATAANKKWREKNWERYLATCRAWNANHPENKERRRIYSQNFRKKHPTAMRESNFKRSYGMTIADYDRMYLAQGGLCAICSESHKTLHVDHDHSTDTVRELLCRKCNFMPGNARESIVNLQQAVRYLRRHAYRELAA